MAPTSLRASWPLKAACTVVAASSMYCGAGGSLEPELGRDVCTAWPEDEPGLDVCTAWPAEEPGREEDDTAAGGPWPVDEPGREEEAGAGGAWPAEEPGREEEAGAGGS
jgi:hypothetical protein